VKTYVEEDQTGSRLWYAEKEGVERSKERRNGGRATGERGIMEKSGVGGRWEDYMRERDKMQRGGGGRRKGRREVEGGGLPGRETGEEGAWKKGEKWNDGKERWRREEGEVWIWEGKGGS